MSKAVMKKARRLKKTVRKTLGTLFLVSALVIAAIPVDGLQASNVDGGIQTYAVGNASIIEETVKSPVEDSWIPQMKADTQIYTSADKLLRFAYLTDRDGVQGAVIVGYSAQNLTGNSLDFTQPVDAYGQYRDNNASERNLVAVGKSDNFLFYREPVTRTLRVMTNGTVGDTEPTYNVVGTDTNRTYYEYVSETNILEENTGNVIGREITVKVESGEFFPCYLEDYDKWHAIEGDVGQNLYYDTVTANNGTDPNRAVFHKADVQAYQRLTKIPITYISNQYTTKDASGKWIPVVDGLTSGATKPVDKTKGIFATNQNIINLKVSENLKGIGDYAFYNTGLKEITLSNGLRYIGTGAFENCLSLEKADLDVTSNLTILGAWSFRNCQSLASFVLPRGVETIGDSAFENCIAMHNLDLCSGGGTNHLKTLGRDVFKDCVSLRSLTFPNNCDQPVYMSCFRGCTALEWICARNKQIQFLDEPGTFSYDDFKAQVTDEFYFEGLGNFSPEWNYEDDPTKWPDSMVHYIAWKNNFAFSYLGYRSTEDGGVEYYKQNYYELTVGEKDASGTEVGKNTFIVNNSNELEIYKTSGDVTSLTIPNKIGKQSIATIKAGVFENKCNLQKVSIPQSVETIKTNAFRGCHNLTNVIFESGNIVIEADAFKTQNFTLGAADHLNVCPSKNVETESDNSPTKKLHFTGPIASDSAPFQYAMSEAGRYNAGSQKESYIIYYSGLPQNLQVEYDPVQKKSVLTDFPSLVGLESVYTSDKYTYLDSDYAGKAKEAVSLYLQSGGTGGMTEEQKAMIDSALNIVIPEGVQLVKPGLFKEKEKENEGKILTTAAENTFGMTVTAFSLEKIEGGVEEEKKFTDPVTNKETIEVTVKEGTGTFADCRYLTGVTLNNDAARPVTIEDHAFRNCVKLENASMANVSSLGVRPFAGCEKLADINFQNSEKYTCENSIIFEKDGSGNKFKVVECLEGRQARYVNPEEMTGITELADEAFMECENLRRVDLTASTITKAPKQAFAYTTDMQDILLPESCNSFGDNVFEGSGVTFLSIPYPGTSIVMTPDSMKGLDNTQTAIGCIEGSFIYQYAKDNGFETLPPQAGNKVFTVTFMDYVDGRLVEVSKVQVEGGKYISAEKIPTPNGRPGQVFTGWQADDDAHTVYTGPFEVTEDVTCMAMYDVAPPDHDKLTVTFRDEAGNLLKNVYVVSGGSVESIDIPSAPAKEGYAFIGWDRPLTNITESFTTYPQYRAVAGDECVVRYFVNGQLYYTTVVKTGENAPNVSVDGRTDVTWVPSLNNIVKDTDFTAVFNNGTGSGNNPGDPDDPNKPDDPNNPDKPNNPGNSDGTGSGNNAGTLHTLTVQGGSGSGSYVAGTQVIISANTPPRGQVFSSWTVSPSSTVTTDKNQSSFIVTMPNNDVAVIANYKAGNSSSTGTGSGSNTNSNRPTGSSGTVNKGGTTVVIDKNGLSNTGVVSATVNGSSDNFTIKVTEDTAASEAVLRALQAEYGSLDNIKYFPMDISLYDSTGTRKITDTTGLSISITLPLPDSLIAYAGNNKVAGVVNDRLDKLSPKFTTINGVACVTFTAEHFSPYVIYVDVTRLSDGTITDNTPQTGDWIHPKWFLSIGLACLSFVMFMMKDNRRAPKKKQRVAV